MSNIINAIKEHGLGGAYNKISKEEGKFLGQMEEIAFEVTGTRETETQQEYVIWLLS